MQIRQATIHDANDVLRLYATYDRPEAPPLSRSDIEAVFGNLGAGSFIAIGEEAWTVVATYCFYLCPSLAHGGASFGIIENMIVATGCRRRGLGRQLLLHAETYARAKNCYKIALTVSHQRVENHGFYQACGYVPDKLGFNRRLHG